MAISKRRKSQQSRQANEAERLRMDNEIVFFIENQVADSEKKNACGNELNKRLFPVFLSCEKYGPAIGKRKNNFGNLKSYRKPIPHPNPTIKRLISKPVPKQTQHNLQKNTQVVVGENIGFMGKWVVKQSHTSVSEESEAVPDADPTSKSVIELECESDDCSSDTDHAPDHTEDVMNKLEATKRIHKVDLEYK